MCVRVCVCHLPHHRDHCLSISSRYYLWVFPQCTHTSRHAKYKSLHLINLSWSFDVFDTLWKHPCGFWKFCFWISCSFVLLPRYHPSKNIRYLLIVSLYKDNNDLICDCYCVSERHRDGRGNASLIKNPTAGYQCSTKALENSLVTLVTARTDSGECQCKKVSTH